MIRQGSSLDSDRRIALVWRQSVTRYKAWYGMGWWGVGRGRVRKKTEGTARAG